MSLFYRGGKTRKGDGRNYREARKISENIAGIILRDEKEREKHSKPIEKKIGPRQAIIEYVNLMKKFGKQVSDEDIIEFMQKRMKNADREYIQNLIDQIRIPIIIAYYKFRSSDEFKAIEDIVEKYPNIDRKKVKKAIQSYRIDPNSLCKSEKIQVDEALKKIIDEANKGNNRDDTRVDR